MYVLVMTTNCVWQIRADWDLGAFLLQGKQKYWLPGVSVNIMLGAICVAKAKIVKKQYVPVDCLVIPAIFLAFYIKRKPFITLCEISAVFSELFSVLMVSVGGVCSNQWIILRVLGVSTILPFGPVRL